MLRDIKVSTGADDIRLSDGHLIDGSDLLELYEACGCECPEGGDQLTEAMAGSDQVVTAWCGGRLVALCSSLSDGRLLAVVHRLLVHPDYRGRGLGRALLARLLERYETFPQRLLLAPADAEAFCCSAGFVRSDHIVPMRPGRTADVLDGDGSPVA